MSMELVAVLSGSDLPDQMQWQMALVRLGLPWRFEVSSYPAAANGFCPMRAGKVVSGVEILNDTLEALSGHLVLDGPYRVISFRWSGDLVEYACALTAAAALVEACGAVIHDPSEEPTRIDPLYLNAMAAEVSAQALEENSQSLTVQKVVRAISKMPEMDWRFVVGGRVVCRSIEGPYLRGIHVDRTSSPGVYVLRAMQTLWSMIEENVYLNHSIELGGFRGGLDRIVGGFRHQLAIDEGIRRCLMADPGEPFLFDPRFYSGVEINVPHPWVERAIMRAMDGDGIGALPLLKRATVRYPGTTSRTADHPWKIIPEAISSIEQGGDVGALLYPLSEEAKKRISIKPIRGRKPSVSSSTPPPDTVR